MIRRDLLKYGVWAVLAVVVFAWELVAVKSLRKAVGLPPRDHPTISELVWSFQRRFGHAGQAVVLVVLADLAAHFLAHTSLLPGI